MSKKEVLGPTTTEPTNLRHARRRVRTALELAVVTLAPTELVDGLAMSAGLLEALSELPRDSPPVVALVPRVVARTNEVLEHWQSWHAEHVEKKMPKG